MRYANRNGTTFDNVSFPGDNWSIDYGAEQLTLLFGAGFAGDFDGNGVLDVADINALLAALGGADPQFDLDSSGTVDLADRDVWLTSAGNANIGAPYVTGDADLDGDVEAPDLNALGINWRSEENLLWQHGNFNGDAIVDAQDLNAVGINWQHGVPAAATAVPEPASLALLGVGLVALAAIRRRRT